MEKAIKLGIDIMQNKVPTEYSSKRNPEEVLREELIRLNGGSSEFNYKQLRGNKGEIYSVIEELVDVIVETGFKQNEFFNKLVDYRNLSLGDKNKFFADTDTNFVVSKIADGIATPRRQRIAEARSVEVDTSIHAIRMYEEFSRFMSGRIDWNELVDAVTKAFNNEILNDIYATISGVSASTPGLDANYVPTAGSYSEDTLVGLIDLIEAATGKTAIIMGTRAALRKLNTAVTADAAKDDMYNMGYIGKFNGTNVYRIPQVITSGTGSTKAFDDNKIYVFAGDDKPIKFVYEGDPILLDKTELGNADMSVEYLCAIKWGCGLIVGEKFAIYETT